MKLDVYSVLSGLGTDTSTLARYELGISKVRILQTPSDRADCNARDTANSNLENALPNSPGKD
jgi:hypothetical protein